MDLIHHYWPHTLGTIIALFLLSLLHEGFRTLLSDLLVNRLVNAWKAFWGIKDGSKIPSGGAPIDEPVTTQTFREHVRGDEQILSAIKAGLDQNSRVVHAAALDVSTKVTEMKEDNKLVKLALEEHRRENDRKMGELHDKINLTQNMVSTLKGSADAVIEIAKGQMKNG